jgi:hypothetical protein
MPVARRRALGAVTAPMAGVVMRLPAACRWPPRDKAFAKKDLPELKKFEIKY